MVHDTAASEHFGASSQPPLLLSSYYMAWIVRVAQSSFDLSTNLQGTLWGRLSFAASGFEIHAVKKSLRLKPRQCYMRNMASADQDGCMLKVVLSEEEFLNKQLWYRTATLYNTT